MIQVSIFHYARWTCCTKHSWYGDSPRPSMERMNTRNERTAFDLKGTIDESSMVWKPSGAISEKRLSWCLFICYLYNIYHRYFPPWITRAAPAVSFRGQPRKPLAETKKPEPKEVLDEGWIQPLKSEVDPCWSKLFSGEPGQPTWCKWGVMWDHDSLACSHRFVVSACFRPFFDLHPFWAELGVEFRNHIPNGHR